MSNGWLMCWKKLTRLCLGCFWHPTRKLPFVMWNMRHYPHERFYLDYSWQLKQATLLDECLLHTKWWHWQHLFVVFKSFCRGQSAQRPLGLRCWLPQCAASRGASYPRALMDARTKFGILRMVSRFCMAALTNWYPVCNVRRIFTIQMTELLVFYNELVMSPTSIKKLNRFLWSLWESFLHKMLALTRATSTILQKKV